jgi:hypothetical protein
VTTNTERPRAPVPAPVWYTGPRALGDDVSPTYEKVPLAFYLTTHKQGWLWRQGEQQLDYRLFVSHRRLQDAAHLQAATVPGWALDSGGFTELSMYGRWMTSPREYVRQVVRYDRLIGRLEWASPQDWMCEPAMIHGGTVDGRRIPGTGLSVAEHQRRTIANFIELRTLWELECDLEGWAAECPFMPVLQGWEPGDYLRCADLYDAAGVRLEDYPIVGLGTVCRRNDPADLLRVLDGVIPALTPYLALHAFGMKRTGLQYAAHLVTSADSASWSYTARREHIVLPGHTHSHCGNCPVYAAQWREQTLAQVEGRTGIWPHWSI